MKLFFSSASPYVRKCTVFALELGLADRIETLPSKVSPVLRDASVVQANPLGKVPTLITEDGVALFDSRVICEYLNAEGGGALFPAADHPQRFAILAQQALADGILDAALLARYETTRPEGTQWEDWVAGQMAKIKSGLDWVEAHADTFYDRVDVGTISFGCALGYLDFRFADYGWRNKYPKSAAWFEAFSARPSMQATVPQV